MSSGNGAANKFQERALGAFLGAAIGDALGWPNEMPSRRVRGNGGTEVDAINGFVAWHRRSGGQFMPHEEIINAGEYSDDTQLLLCGARSLLHGPDWLGHLVSKELPVWRLYQRGGGGATNRAVDLWIRGQVPWSLDEADPKRQSYFNAGGNGVAMRIMPHVVVGARDETFRSTAQAILLNGITTHGHPRALLGALAYGFALWQAMRLGGTLSYGYLIQTALEHSVEWSSFSEDSGILAEWCGQAQRSLPGGFKQVWAQTLSEMLALLETGHEGIDAGAISLDSRILEELGCFDRRINGAGTICAAAAIYLASKYAPDPQNGLAEAATLKGADTDTIASMAGCLLGTVSGTEWLQRYRNQLQDESYITKIAQRLDLVHMDQDESNRMGLPTRKQSQDLERFLLLLRKGKVNDDFEMPDGRKVSLKGILPIKTASHSLSGTQWQLKTDDGQILYVKKLDRKTRDANQLESQIASTGSTKSSARKRLGFKIKIKAIKVVVENLERSRWFYQDILGLKIARESKTLVNFGELLTLVSYDHGDVGSPNKEKAGTQAILCLECSDIQSCHDRLRALVEVKVTPIHDRSGRKAFRCVDIDGNTLEIFEALPSKQQISGQKP